MYRSIPWAEYDVSKPMHPQYELTHCGAGRSYGIPFDPLAGAIQAAVDAMTEDEYSAWLAMTDRELGEWERGLVAALPLEE